MINQFETKKQALDFLESIDWLTSHSNGKKYSSNRTYYLNHGEYAKPAYYPVKYKDGWAIKADYFYYGGTVGARKDGRMDDETFTELFLTDD